MNDETKVGVAGQDQSAPVKESTPETPAAGRAVPRHERAGRYVESTAREVKAGLELRSFEFEDGYLKAVLECDHDTNTIHLRFDISADTNPSVISPRKQQMAEKIARDIARPLDGFLQRLSDRRHGYKPMVSLSRPYVEPNRASLIVDVEQDRTADTAQTLRILVERLVDHKLNKDHSYKYKTHEYGRNKKWVAPHEWTEQDLRKSQLEQREDETPEQYQERLRSSEFDTSPWEKLGRPYVHVAGFDEDLATVSVDAYREARIGIRRPNSNSVQR